MKKLTALLLALMLLLPCMSAPNGGSARAASSAVSGWTLKPSDDEVKVYARPSLSANIVGYIIFGGRQEVEVLSVTGDWCYVRFTSIYGDTFGYIPLSRFQAPAAATPTPSPTATPVPQSSSGVVSHQQPGQRLNLRTGPSTSTASLGKYYSGTPLAFTGLRQNGYVQVIIGATYGWMDERYVTTYRWSAPNEMPLTAVENPGRGANLRFGPDTGHRILGWYAHGTAVTVMGVRADGWYHVQVKGQTGFMSETVLRDRFPWQYGPDADDPAISVDAMDRVMYVDTDSSVEQQPLRQKASYDAATLGRFYTGTPVRVLSWTRTGWAYVDIGGLTGYMDLRYLADSKPPQAGVSRLIRNPYGTGLNLRSAPDSSSEILQFCPNYMSLTVLGDVGSDWCYVDVRGQTGFMLKKRLEKSPW